MPTPLDSFLAQLQAAGLMTEDEARAWLARRAPGQRPADPTSMAWALVDAGKLSHFQADELLAGRGRQLAFGDYTLEDRLGVGAMGQVYKARHRKMNRVVALKVLQPALARSPDMIARFHREVQAAARLIHPHIVAALDASEHEGVHYLVMEYVEGRDLANLVKREGPLPIAAAVDYVLQAARGLEHAHAEGIVHRDIKPGNLLVDKRGVVKILDLGSASMENVWGEPLPEDDEGLTHTGNILGTVDYMAPEQALNLRNADCRADIYGLGCTLYRLLTNQRIYPGETVLERILAHRDAPIPRLRGVRPEIPESLEMIFARMVAKRPEDRYASMSDVSYDLEQLLDTLPKTVNVSHGGHSADAADPRANVGASAHAENADTVWSDSPAPLGDESEADEAVDVHLRSEPLLPSAGVSALAVAEPVSAPTARKPQPKPLPSAEWVWPLVGVIVLAPIVIIALLPGSQPVAAPANKALDELNRRERFVADPPFSERTLDRMRRDFDQFAQHWQQVVDFTDRQQQAEWRALDREQVEWAIRGWNPSEDGSRAVERTAP